MATSVKMRDEDKRRLDRLQGKITAMRGRKVSQQALMAWLLGLGEGRPADFADDNDRPMTEREIAALLRLPVNTGVYTREKDIDRDLYGAPP